MGFKLTSLSYEQSDLTSSEQSVLTNLCHRANDQNNECYPSIKKICLDTKFDRKVVQKCIQSLIDKNLMIKTGKLTGRTKSIPVYKIIISDPRIGTASLLNDISDPIFDDKRSHISPSSDPISGIRNNNRNNKLIINNESIKKSESQKEKALKELNNFIKNFGRKVL